MHSLTTNWRQTSVILLLIASVGVYRVRDASDLWGGQAVDWQVKLEAAVWLFLGLIVLRAVWEQKFSFQRLISGPIRWYFAYIVLALISSLYSTSPVLTMFRSYQLLVFLALLSAYPEGATNIRWAITIFVCANLFLAGIGHFFEQEWFDWVDDTRVYDTATSDVTWRLSSAVGHPVAIGFVASTGALLEMTRKGAKKSWKFFLFWLFVITTILTVSRTAIAGLVVGLVCIAIGRRGTGVLLFVCMFLVSVLFLTGGGLFQEVPGFLLRGQSQDDVSTLTGRTEIWKSAFARGKESFLLGEGFSAGRRDPLTDFAGGITHAHNLLLEGFLGLGLVGVTCLLLTLISVLNTVLGRGLEFSYAAFCVSESRLEVLGALMPFFLCCVLTPGFAGDAGPISLLSIGILFLFSRRADALRSRTRSEDM